MKIMIPEGLSTNDKVTDVDDQQHHLALIEHYENGVLIAGDHNHGMNHQDNIDGHNNDYIFDQDDNSAPFSGVHHT